MSIGLSEFWTRLVRSGITDAAGCKTLAGEFVKANNGAPIDSAEQLADFLVSQSRLTAFQSQALLSDPPIEIRLGPFLVRSAGPPAPFSRWTEVDRLGQGPGGESGDGNRPGPAAERGVLLRSTPGNAWLDAHANVRDEHLVRFDVEPMGQTVAVFSGLPDGQSLADQIQADRPRFAGLDRRVVCNLGIAIAGGLQRMHDAGLVHGSVRADRIWIGKRGESLLLRDPAGPPTAGLGDVSGQWLDTTDSPEWYSAPELSLGGAACSGSSDIYSLGCLLFRLVTGRPPVQAASPRQTLQAHATESPPELVDAIEKGESGDAIFRVLAYALAKDPASRFASASSLADALGAVLPTLASPAAAQPVPPKRSEPASPAGKLEKSAPAIRVSDKKGASKETVRTQPSGDVDEKPQEVAAQRPKKQKPTKQKPTKQVATKQVAKEKRSAEPVTQPGSNPEQRVAPESASQSASQSISESKPAPRSSLAPAPQPASPAEPASLAKPASPAKSGSVPASPADALLAAEPVGQTEPPARPTRRRRRKPNRAPYVLTGLTVIVLLLMIALLVTDPNPQVAQRRDRPALPAVVPPVSNRTVPSQPPSESMAATEDRQTNPRKPAGDADGQAASGGYQLVQDDRLLFAPPTPRDSGPPSLGLLPPGPAMIVSARLSSIRASATGDQLIETFSPELSGLIELAVARTGVQASSIDRVTVALFPGSDGWPEASLAIELIGKTSLDTLTKSWQAAESRTRDGQVVYAGDEPDSDAYYVDRQEAEAGSVSRFGVGSLPRMTEVASIDGEPIPLPRAMQGLWDSTDQDSEVVALISPNFLFSDGRQMLMQTAPELMDSLRRVLIPDASGASIRLDFGDSQDGRPAQVFGEVRLSPSGGISQAALMRKFQDSVGTWPGWADQFIVDAVADPSWRLLASRLPSMVRYVADRIRFGISDNMIVANTYLPAPAFNQTTLATLLAMNTPPGQALAGGGGATDGPMSVQQMLDRPMTVSFDQESLEFAIDVIVEEFNRKLPADSQLPAVRIIGGDLQKMGITQNQQIRDFSKTDQSLRSVLTDLVVGANPDKTATGPDDPKQALIWVVTDDPENPGKTAILVTTRQAAQGRFDLPAEFVAPE